MLQVCYMEHSNENKVFQNDSSWYTAEHTIVADKHIYVICVFKNSAGTVFLLSTLTVVIETLSATNSIQQPTGNS